MLYNLESKSSGEQTNLEKFSLRALIYRELCAKSAMEALDRNFQVVFGRTLRAIRLGESLQNSSVLKSIDVPETQKFRDALESFRGLRQEEQSLSKLPASLQKLAHFVYSSQLKLLDYKIRMLRDNAIKSAANFLNHVAEQLRFLLNAP